MFIIKIRQIKISHEISVINEVIIQISHEIRVINNKYNSFIE